jgi:hypothetical protein
VHAAVIRVLTARAGGCGGAVTYALIVAPFALPG